AGSGGLVKSIQDLDLSGKRLFLRVDFNVPIQDGQVADATRIRETLPTVRLAREKGARVICASHLGKPRGKASAKYSLAPVAVKFAELLAAPVRFVEECIGPEAERAAGALEAGGGLLPRNLPFPPRAEGDGSA